MSCSMMRREKLSLWLRSSMLKSGACSSTPGVTTELLHDVRQDLSDLHANTHHMS